MDVKFDPNKDLIDFFVGQMIDLILSVVVFFEINKKKLSLYACTFVCTSG